MMTSALVSLEPLQGLARLGTMTVAIAPAGSQGELWVGGETGSVLRPLTVGERNRLVWEAMASPQPQPTLWEGLRSLGTVSSPGQSQDEHREPIDDCVLDVIALALAGGLWENAPHLDRTMMLVARETGWSPQQLSEAIALEVDQLALSLEESLSAPASSDTGWKRLVLLSPEESDLSYIREQLANNLLRRGQGAAETNGWQEEPLSLPISNRGDQSEDRVEEAMVKTRAKAIAPFKHVLKPEHKPISQSNHSRVSLHHFSLQTKQPKLETTSFPNQYQLQPTVNAQPDHPLQTKSAQLADQADQLTAPLPKSQRFSTRPLSSFPTSLPTSLATSPTHPPTLGQTAGKTLKPTTEPIQTEPIQTAIPNPIQPWHGRSPAPSPPSSSSPSPHLPLHPLTPPPPLSISLHPTPSPSPPLATDLADTLATLLHHEADLRGIPR